MKAFKLPKFKACIFDLDGTLLDSMWVWKKIDRIFLTKRGLTFSEEYCKALASMKIELAAEYTAAFFNLSETPEEIINEWITLAKEAFTLHIQPKPFALKLLRYLKNNDIPAAIATTSQEELYLPALERLGITDMFNAIIDSQTVNCGKDRPDIFLKAASVLNMKPYECIVFEDTPKAILCAKKAGFVTVGFLDSHTPEVHDEIKSLSHFTAYDFEEFFNAITAENLNQAPLFAGK